MEPPWSWGGGGGYRRDLGDPWQQPYGGGRPPDGMMRALEARFAAIETALADHRFQLDGRLAEVERQFDHLEQRLAGGGGPVSSAFLNRAGGTKRRPRKWDDEEEPDGAFCGMLADDPREAGLHPSKLEFGENGEDFSRKDLTQVVDEQSYYQVKQSCWDACCFVGTSYLPGHTNVGLTLSTLLNVAIQVLFSGIIWSYVDEPRYNGDLVKKSHEWRYRAQTYRMSDSTTHASLASRVCAGDDTLSYATGKAEWATELTLWLRGNNFLLCVLSIFLWGLTIFEEIFNTVQFLTSVVCLPWGAGTHIGFTTGKPELRAISTGRALLAVTVALVRMAIAVLLLYVGSVWLINTDSPDDLILNAVALNFLLQCDELVYAVFCPPTARALIQSFEPIPLKKKHRLPLQVVVSVAWIALPAFIIFLARDQLIPYQELKAQVMDALCGGQKQFVFDIDALGRVLYAWVPESNAPQSPLDVHRSHVIQGIIHNQSSDQLAAIRMDLTELNTAMKMGRGYLTKFWKCKDNPADLRLAYGAVGIDDLSACADAVPYCQGEGYSFIRAVCPQTCGCADPLAGLVEFRHGCPRDCFTSAERMSILKQLPCMDRPLTWLNATVGWGNFLTELANLLSAQWKHPKKWIAERVVVLRRLGCAALAHPKVQEIGMEIMCGPMAGFCPIGCRCSTMQSEDATWFCPSQCAVTVAAPSAGQLAPP